MRTTCEVQAPLVVASVYERLEDAAHNVVGYRAQLTVDSLTEDILGDTIPKDLPSVNMHFASFRFQLGLRVNGRPPHDRPKHRKFNLRLGGLGVVFPFSNS
jgi:hypothetical protein